MGTVVTRSQLAADGIAQSTISKRCRHGRYVRVLPGVYCEGTLTTSDRCAAVVEWLPEAHLSHRTAAWLLGMLPEPTVVEATVPAARYRKTPAWLRLYRRDLAPDMCDELAEFPITTPARTLLDCITVLPDVEAGRLVDAHLRRIVDPSELARLSRAVTVGGPAVRRQLREAALHSLSEPERLFARALARRDLRLFANHPVGPFHGDFVDEVGRTVVEIDGREFHSDAVVFRRDRRRQNWLVVRGWLVLRYAAQDVMHNLDQCADEVQRVVLARRKVAKTCSRLRFGPETAASGE